MGQALDHHAHHGPLHPRLVVFGLALVVDGQPAALAEPGEGALHDPAAGQDLKVVDALAFADDLDRQREDLGGPGDQLASVAGISPDQPEGREVGAEAPQQPPAAVAVLGAGRVTRTSSSSPPVSTARCRLRPWTFLAAS